MQGLENITYPFIELPSGRKVQFRSVSFRDKRRVQKDYDRESGYMLEELLAAYALQSEDGSPVAEAWAVDNIVQRMDHWPVRDVQYYISIFADVVLIDDENMNKAREEAKKLLKGDTTNTPVQDQQELKPRKNLKINTGGTT